MTAPGLGCVRTGRAPGRRVQKLGAFFGPGVICFHPTLKIILTGSESLAVLLAVR